MVYEGTEQITSLMIGDMGIKSAFVGLENVHERPGGYFYLILDTSKGE